jgi:hypothetical protein
MKFIGVSLEKFLIEKAKSYIEECGRFVRPRIKYSEDVESNYNKSWGYGGDIDCSYIYKVGVLAVIDGNKSDYAKFFIACERDEGEFDYFGELYFHQGENTDMKRTIQRIYKCMDDSWY